MENQIKSTEDYGKFKLHPLNRPISLGHLSRLTKEISANNQLDINPIIVDKDWYIISGQHRYYAAKKLGIPIYYIQKDVEGDYILKANQMQKRTSVPEAIDFYIKTQDSESYKILKEMKAEFGIPYGACTALLGHNIGKSCKIIDGLFDMGDEVPEAVQYVEKYRELKRFLDQQQFDYRSSYKSTHFLQGFRKFLESNEVDWESFMKKIRMYWSCLDCAQPTGTAWTRKFISIYNKKRYRNFIGEEG